MACPVCLLTAQPSSSSSSSMQQQVVSSDLGGETAGCAQRACSRPSHRLIQHHGEATCSSSSSMHKKGVSSEVLMFGPNALCNRSPSSAVTY
jgi:hypothetical protein